jgi:hypothetical protein
MGLYFLEVQILDKLEQPLPICIFVDDYSSCKVNNKDWEKTNILILLLYSFSKTLNKSSCISQTIFPFHLLQAEIHQTFHLDHLRMQLLDM